MTTAMLNVCEISGVRNTTLSIIKKLVGVVETIIHNVYHNACNKYLTKHTQTMKLKQYTWESIAYFKLITLIIGMH